MALSNPPTNFGKVDSQVHRTIQIKDEKNYI
jgi:hypothetical protein